MERRTKTKQIKFRVTENDYKKIKNKIEKSKLSQDDYLLKCALDKEIVIIDGLREIIYEVKKIGTNINQLAKISNQKRVVSSTALDNMNKELSEVWQLLRLLIQKQV